MNVMAAGMHDADFLAGGIPRHHVTGVIDTGLLDNGQRIQIRADQQTRAGPIFEQRHDAKGRRAVRIPADMLGDRITGMA